MNASKAHAALFALVVVSGCVAPQELENVDQTADAVSTTSVRAPRPNDMVTFGRENKDRLTEVPITKNRFDKPKVLLSVKLEDLTTSEDLLLRGELTLSTCGGKDISGDASDGEKNPCSIPQLKQSPYNYSPHFGAYIVLGNSAGDTDGPKLSPMQDTNCTGREHHCTLAIPQSRTKSPVTAAGAKYANLVVAADDPASRSFDLMIVEQDHALIAVTRVADGAGGAVIQKTSKDPLQNVRGNIDIDREEGDGGPLGVDPKVHHEIYQVKLEGLKPGDIIDADAKLVAKVHGGPAACDAYMSHEIVITSTPNATGHKKPGDEWLTRVNGKNCTDHGGECVYRKSGAAELGRDASSTMFVTLIATAGRTCVPPGYTWEVQNGGSLDVSVRR